MTLSEPEKYWLGVHVGAAVGAKVSIFSRYTVIFPVLFSLSLNWITQLSVPVIDALGV